MLQAHEVLLHLKLYIINKNNKKLLSAGWFLSISISNCLECLTLLPFNIKVYKVSCSFFILEVIMKLKINEYV